jgi:CYTH domain-containing protein
VCSGPAKRIGRCVRGRGSRGGLLQERNIGSSDGLLVPTPRRFLISSSLARLLRREGGVERRVVEGHFPVRKPGRTHFVSVEPGRTELVLADAGGADGEALEQRTEVPHAHTEALLDLCAGKVGFERTRIRFEAGYQVVLERILHPATLDVIRVLFGEGEQPFAAPAWFGPEVTLDPAWDKRTIALQGAPVAPEIPLSNAALDALLNDLERSPPGPGQMHG